MFDIGKSGYLSMLWIFILRPFDNRKKKRF
jgi:hypothetical protein